MPYTGHIWGPDGFTRYQSREEYDRLQRKLHPPIPLTWAEIIKGLGSSAASGYTSGFSDYIPASRAAEEKFADQYPITSGLVDGAATVASFFNPVADATRAAKGVMLGIKGIQALKAAMEGTNLGAKALKGAEVAGNVLSKVSNPTVLIDKYARKGASALPYMEKISKQWVPDAASAAAQSFVHTYNTARSDDKKPISQAVDAATASAILGPWAGALTSLGGKLINKAAGSTVGALGRLSKATGLGWDELTNKLSGLGANARTYDIDPAALGAGGVLSNLGRTYPKFAPIIRNAAADDMANIGETSKGLTEKYLGPSLPTSYRSVIEDAKNTRSRVAAPLYRESDSVPVDLAAHPDLLNNYVLTDDFKNYLTRSNQANPVNKRNINRFLANRDSVVKAGDEVLKAVKDVPINDADLHTLYGDTIQGHIARNNLDLSLPPTIIQDYIDHVAANRAPYAQTFTRLAPNPVNDAARLANTTSKAMQEISPEYAAAQQAWAQQSIPKDQAELARNIFQTGDTGGTGSAKRLDSEVTDEFLKHNQELRDAAKAANLPDNSRPLTRFVLDEAINKTAGRNAGKVPSAILNNINTTVEPRFSAVFGKEPVANLIKEAQANDQLIKNRAGLARLGYPDDGDTGKMFYHRAHPDVLKILTNELKRIFLETKDKALLEVLQQDPQKTIASIQQFMKKNPNGTIADYRRYLASLTGNLGGQVIYQKPEKHYD